MPKLSLSGSLSLIHYSVIAHVDTPSRIWSLTRIPSLYKPNITEDYGGGNVGEGVSVGGRVGAMVAVPVGVVAAVVLIGVFVSEGESVCDGVNDGCTGALVVGIGDKVGSITVIIGPRGVLVGVLVSMGVNVTVWLETTVTRRVDVSLAAIVDVELKLNPGSHGATSVNPWLNVFSIVNNLIPTSRSLSVNALPAGCCTSHPYASNMVASM